MMEYPNFVYLDARKTGSSFVRLFLCKYAKGPAIQSNAHKAISTYDKNKYYFITCRDPLDQYLSLYSYGCTGLGTLRRRLEREDKADWYDGSPAGFSAWLNFTLDPCNASFVGTENYAQSGAAQLVGLQTYRLLWLSFACPEGRPQILRNERGDRGSVPHQARLEGRDQDGGA